MFLGGDIVLIKTDKAIAACPEGYEQAFFISNDIKKNEPTVAVIYCKEWVGSPSQVLLHVHHSKRIFERWRTSIEPGCVVYTPSHGLLLCKEIMFETHPIYPVLTCSPASKEELSGAQQKALSLLSITVNDKLSA